MTCLLLQSFNGQPGAGKGQLQLEQARAILMSGDLQRAYDTAADVLNMTAAKEVHFAAYSLCGLLCHSQWAAQLQYSAPGALALC